jgi:hypothetical protein
VPGNAPMASAARMPSGVPNMILMPSGCMAANGVALFRALVHLGKRLLHRRVRRSGIDLVQIDLYPDVCTSESCCAECGPICLVRWQRGCDFHPA